MRNKATKVQSTFTAEKWAAIQMSQQWRGVFEVVEMIPEPPEVTELKRSQSQA